MGTHCKWKWAGARWWKFDFHTHTPQSADYGKGPDQEALRKHTPKEWLLDYMRADFDGVVVTDHNTGAWIDRLKEAFNKLKEEKHPDFHTLYIFPGVEISVIDGIHVLAILPMDKGSGDIDTLLGAVGIMGDKGKTDSVTTKSPQEVIDIISKTGGIAVPAHADKEKQKRQVIVVPHNANIVVNGNAENVIALDVRGGQTRIICQVSRQGEKIRDEICRVLEGGKEAFDLRYQRIGAGGCECMTARKNCSIKSC